MIVGYINGQSLEIHHTRVVADSVDYLTADFVFQTNEWLGFRKWVHFKKGEEHYQIMLSNDKVTKKDHLNLSQGEWEVYIHGSLDNEVITTNKSTLKVEATGDLNGKRPEESPIPPYDAILNLIGDLKKLDTETKENLVSAINEVLKEAEENNGFQDIDLSDYALKTEIPTKISELDNDKGFITNKDLPDINFYNLFEPFTDKKNPDLNNTNPEYWIDNARIGNLGDIETALYPTCVTDLIPIIDNVYYEVEGDCYENSAYQYDNGGNYIGVTPIGVYVGDTYMGGKFKTLERAANIRLVVPKFNDVGEELDLAATIERFNNKFKLYYCDKYKLKDNVVLPDNVVIPTKTSDLVAELETFENGNNALVFGGENDE